MQKKLSCKVKKFSANKLPLSFLPFAKKKGLKGFFCKKTHFLLYKELKSDKKNVILRKIQAAVFNC